MANVEDLSQNKLHFTTLTCISQASSTMWLSCSAPYEPTPRRTHLLSSKAAQQSLILDISEGISTHACCETALVLAAPQTEPPIKGLSTTATTPVPTDSQFLPLPNHYADQSSLQEEMSREAEASADVLFPVKQPAFQWNENFCLCRHHSPVFILPNVTQISWHISRRCDSTSVFLGILCGLGNRSRRTYSSSPRVPQDNSEIALLTQRNFSHYQVTEFLTHWTMCSWEKAPGKKKLTLFCFYRAFHCYHLPNLRMKSCFLPFSSRKWPWFLSPMMHVWCQKKCHKKSWVGRKENNYLQLGHSMDPTSTEAKCFTHFPQGNTTNREQRVQENKAEKQEAGAHKQMVANKQTKGKHNHQPQKMISLSS